MIDLGECKVAIYLDRIVFTREDKEIEIAIGDIDDDDYKKLLEFKKKANIENEDI